MPLKRDQIMWIDDETLEDKWHHHCQHILDQLPSDPEVDRLLKNWVIYYLHAPMWQWNQEAFEHTVKPLLEKDLLSLTLAQLIDECLQIGIDPL